MTISTDLARVVHEGNGVTTLFSLSGMEQVKTSNVVVTLVAADGTEMPQVLGADYSLSPAGVTFVVPPAAGVRVVIQRIEPLIQPDQYTTNAPFPAAVTERRFDSVVMGLQQHADAAKRALRAGIEDTANLTVPPVSVRANRLLGFDTQGNVIASPGVQAGGVLFSLFGETFVGSADAAAARALLAVLSSAETNALFSVALLRDGTQEMTGALRVASGTFGGLRRRDEVDTRIVTVGSGQWRVDCSGTTVLMCNPTGVSINPALALAGPATSDTQAPQLGQLRLAGASWVTLSGTAVDFTGIPSSAREVILMLRGADMSLTTEHILVQIGSGSSPVVSGYVAAGHVVGASGIGLASGAGLLLYRQSTTRFHTCEMRWVRVPGSGMWVGSYTGFAAETGEAGGAIFQTGGAAIAPGTVGDVNILRLRGSGGSATFVAGQAAVAWRL